MSINRVILTGNLTRDCELRRTQAGMAVMSFGIAVDDRRKNSQTGDWEDYANFIDCTMFGTRAEAVANYISKGSKVGLEGKLRYSTWENGEGQKRSKLEVIVDEIEFLSPRQGNQGGAQGGYGQQAGGYSYGSGYAPQMAPQQPQGGYGQTSGGYSYGGGNAPQNAPQQPQGGYQREAAYQPSQPQAVEPQVEMNPSIYDDDLPF